MSAEHPSRRSARSPAGILKSPAGPRDNRRSRRLRLSEMVNSTCRLVSVLGRRSPGGNVGPGCYRWDAWLATPARTTATSPARTCVCQRPGQWGVRRRRRACTGTQLPGRVLPATLGEWKPGTPQATGTASPTSMTRRRESRPSRQWRSSRRLHQEAGCSSSGSVPAGFALPLASQGIEVHGIDADPGLFRKSSV